MKQNLYHFDIKLKLHHFDIILITMMMQIQHQFDTKEKYDAISISN